MLNYCDLLGVWKRGFDLNRIWFSVPLCFLSFICRSKVSSPRSLVLNLRFIRPISCLFSDKILFLWHCVIIPPSQLAWSPLPVDPNHSFLHLKWRKAIFVYSHNLSIVPGGDSLWDTAHMNQWCCSRRHHRSLNSFLQSPEGPVNWERTPGEHRREVRVYVHAQ